MTRRASACHGRSTALLVAALVLFAGLASAQTAPASAPARPAAAAPPPDAGAAQTTGAASAPASSTASAPAAGASSGASSGAGSSAVSSAAAPNANNQALAPPTDSTLTAVSAQLLLIGPDAWPFDDDRQAKLVAAIKGDLMYATGRFPDPLKYLVTDVRSSSGASAPPGRKLLQAMNSLVTVQIATGDTNLVSNVRTNLITDVQSGAILTRTKEQGLQLTSIQVASAIYTSPVAPKADTRPQLAAGIAVAGAIVFAFIGWMIYLESEKSRSCCGYHWGMTAVNDGKSAAKASKASKPAAGGVRGWFKRGKAEEVAAGANGADNGNGKLPAHNFDDPKQEVALQPQGASALPPAAPAAGIGRHRIA